MIKYSLLLFLFAFPASQASSQLVSPIVTDRPDFTESGLTVPRGSVQVEGGFTYAVQNEVRQVSGSELLIRWSPIRRLELRFMAPDFVLANREQNISDPALGLKAQLGPVNNWDLALIASTTLPHSSNKKGKAGLDLILAGGSEIGAISLGSQVMTGWDQEAGKLLHGLTVVVGREILENTGGFVEIALSEVPSSAASVLLHSGLTFEVAPLIQLDLHSGIGISETAQDFILGAGLSLRR